MKELIMYMILPVNMVSFVKLTQWYLILRQAIRGMEKKCEKKLKQALFWLVSWQHMFDFLVKRARIVFQVPTDAKNIHYSKIPRNVYELHKSK